MVCRRRKQEYNDIENCSGIRRNCLSILFVSTGLPTALYTIYFFKKKDIVKRNNVGNQEALIFRQGYCACFKV
jgi:hypothetical protein